MSVQASIAVEQDEVRQIKLVAPQGRAHMSTITEQTFKAKHTAVETDLREQILAWYATG